MGQEGKELLLTGISLIKCMMYVRMYVCMYVCMYKSKRTCLASSIHLERSSNNSLSFSERELSSGSAD